jgi:hypothetical protein
MTRSSGITTRGGPSRTRGGCAPKTWISSEGKNSGFCSCWFNRQAVNRWRWNETVNDRNSNALTSQGIMDMKFLARRYASKFEDLMREPYSENTYSVSYRSKMSVWIANPDWFCSFNILTLIGLMTATRLTSRDCSRTTHIKYTPTSSILID